MDQPITDWLVFIGGYMQTKSLATTGMCGMAKQAYDRYKPHGVFVDYEPWKCDWKSLAEWIYRWSGYDHQNPNGVNKPPTIMVAAYSWGAGWGLCQLAQHLAYRGLGIQVAVASDAVRHIGWTWSHSLYVSQAFAYWPWWHIKKPESIDTLYWYRQSRKRNPFVDFINGTTLLYGHGWTDRIDGVLQPCPNGVGVDRTSHTNMDDSSKFRLKVFEMADQLFIPKAA